MDRHTSQASQSSAGVNIKPGVDRERRLEDGQFGAASNVYSKWPLHSTHREMTNKL